MKPYFLATLLLTFIATSCSASPPPNSAPSLAPVVKAAAAVEPAKAASVTTKLSANGKALMPIVISDKASAQVKKDAHVLASYLQKITGASFNVQREAKVLSQNTHGIAIGVVAHFNGFNDKFDPSDPTKTEDYLLRSHTGGVLLVGATEMAVQHAVWDFLYRIGYRQFFPGKAWEIIPHNKNLSVALDTFQHPDYYSRHIKVGYGFLNKENRVKFTQWLHRNRATSGLVISHGHAYGSIIKRHKAEFEAHPEYLTKPGGDKFCVSNPGLQQLVINDTLEQLKENPTRQSVSLEPSDGGGWDSGTCPDAKRFKSITDRVVFLANVVATAVRKKYPQKYFGIYAYNYHSPPPSITLNSHVVPSIATSYIHGGYTVDSLLAGWHQKAQQIGIREYYSIYLWGHELPGQSRASSINYIQTTIPHFYDEGARFFDTETGNDWGPNGLGYYIASRLLWDTSEAKHVDAIKTDFFDKAFGPAQGPVKQFYGLIDGVNKPLLSSDLIGRMYRKLHDALELTNDTAIRARIDDLTLYTRYVELFYAFRQATTKSARQTAFENVLRFAWRIRKTQMVHSWGIWRGLERSPGVKMPKGSGHRVPEAKDPLKNPKPYTPAQIQQMINNGIANNNLRSFTPVSFSHNLVPATTLHLTSGRPGTFRMLRGSSEILTWVKNAPAKILLQVTGGMLYTNRGKVKFSLFANKDKPVDQASILPDRKAHSIALTANRPGLHHIDIDDGNAGTKVSWPEGTPAVFESSLDNAPHFAGARWAMYFYVPKGTKNVGGYRQAIGELKNPNGKTVLKFTRANNPGYWSIPVPPGQDGKLWQLSDMKGKVQLMTVPPYLARSASEMLLPAEVVKADAS